jgi:hypothetical protein
MNIIQKEFMIIISTIMFCYIAYKTDGYTSMTIYLLVRIWIEMRLKDSDD